MDRASLNSPHVQSQNENSASYFGPEPSFWPPRRRPGRRPHRPSDRGTVVTAKPSGYRCRNACEDEIAVKRQHANSAQLMITDHSGVNKSATELVQNCTSLPRANPPAKACKKRGRQFGCAQEAQRSAFDRAYVSTTKWPTTGPCWMPSTRRDSQRPECRTQSAAGQSATRLRGSPRSCQTIAEHLEQGRCMSRRAC